MRPGPDSQEPRGENEVVPNLLWYWNTPPTLMTIYSDCTTIEDVVGYG